MKLCVVHEMCWWTGVLGIQSHDLGGHTYCAPNDPAQRVPCSLIKPVEELVEAIGCKMVCWSVVKPEEEKQIDVKYKCNIKSKNATRCRTQYKRSAFEFWITGKVYGTLIHGSFPTKSSMQKKSHANNSLPSRIKMWRVPLFSTSEPANWLIESETHSDTVRSVLYEARTPIGR